MNKLIRCLFTIYILCFLNTAQATAKCTSDSTMYTNVRVFTDALIATNRVSIELKVRGTDEYFRSKYAYEAINLNSTDYLLWTKPSLNTAQQSIGLGYNMYFGYDANNREIDFYVFQPPNGFNPDFVASFKEAHSNGQCVFKTEVLENSTYAILTVLSNDSFSIEWYEKIDEKKPTNLSKLFFSKH